MLLKLQLQSFVHPVLIRLQSPELKPMQEQSQKLRQQHFEMPMQERSEKLRQEHFGKRMQKHFGKRMQVHSGMQMRKSKRWQKPMQERKRRQQR